MALGIGISGPRGGGGGAIPSLSIGVYSDADLTTPITTADFGDTVYINITTSIASPTEYRFLIFESSVIGNYTLQAGATLSYTISSFEDLIIFAESEDGVSVAAALTPFDLTINADADANAYINAHNALSGQTMAATQQEVVQGTFQRLKGINSTSENLHAFFLANGVRIFGYTPVSDSVVNIDAYGLDMIQLGQQTFHGYVASDFTVQGLKGGAGKYTKTGMYATSFPLNDLGGDVYCRTALSNTIAMSFGSLDTATYNANGYSLWPRWGNAIAKHLNSNRLDGVAIASSKGLLSVQRISATQVSTLLNGGLVSIQNLNSASRPVLEIYGHAANSPSGAVYYDPSEHAWLCPARPTMTATQMTAYNEVVEYYQTNIITGGRNV
jgi:hypothetical protein